MLKEIISKTANADAILKDILERIHKEGPVNPKDFEILAYLKEFYSEIFENYESRLAYLLGLFFKTNEPQNILEAVYNAYAQSIKERTGFACSVFGCGRGRGNRLLYC